MLVEQHPRAALVAWQAGLAACLGSGLGVPAISGRVAAFEVMVVTPTIADMIEDPQRQSDIVEVIKNGRQHAMISFDDYLFDLAEAGHILQDTALANATNVTDLRLRFQGF